VGEEPSPLPARSAKAKKKKKRRRPKDGLAKASSESSLVSRSPLTPRRARKAVPAAPNSVRILTRRSPGTRSQEPVLYPKQNQKTDTLDKRIKYLVENSPSFYNFSIIL